MTSGAELRELPAPKSDFIGLHGKVHLATGGEPPLLKAHRDAFERFARDKSNGFAGYHSHWRVADEVRQQLAAFVGAEAGDVALVGNASEAIMQVISSFDWQGGDNVVVPELDYASGRYGFASLKRRGVELRLVPARGWALAMEDLLAACDQRTRLIYISQVNALTGQQVDIGALSNALEGRPTALMVDASHALGVVPVSGTHCDFLVSCCYKFLLGIHDGILVWNRRRWPDFEPSGVGWHSAEAGADSGSYRLRADAQRAEFGNVGHLGAYLLRESLAYLDGFGVEAIAAHTRTLTQALIEGLMPMGLDVMTPLEPSQRGSNVAFHYPDPGPVVQRAAEENILIWGDLGRIRLSTHLFTTDEDIEILFDRLPALLA